MREPTSNFRRVVIIGAGIAGLAAASKLAHSGVPVTLLEARTRIGGRIFTVREGCSELSIELGAEFMHGFAPEIWQPFQNSNVPITEVAGQSWCFEEGKLGPCNFLSKVEHILKKMDPHSPDESFLQFLNRRFPNPNLDSDLERARLHALRYVIGFNAADPDMVGVHWLVQQQEAEERINGDRAFRPATGYAFLVDRLRQGIEAAHAQLCVNTVVEHVRWSEGCAEIVFHERDSARRMEATQLLITVPLAVLRAAEGELGSIRFDPPLPDQKRAAFHKMEMGHVMRVVFRFRRRFWESIVPSGSKKNLADLGFLFSDDENFPTWWTANPSQHPLLTGWAPFRAAERLSGLSAPAITEAGINSLSKILLTHAAIIKQELVQTYFHDWQTDPFSGGAYAFGGVGADGAAEEMATPIQNTLFFAGEATDVSGNTGTVHGAMASGYRAASQILQKIA